MPTIQQAKYRTPAHVILRDLSLAIPQIAQATLQGRDVGTLTAGEATKAVDAIVSAARAKWKQKNRQLTRETVCKERLFQTRGDVDQAYKELRPLLGTLKCLTFTRNANGTRVPLPITKQARQAQGLSESIPTQEDRLRMTLNAVRKDVMTLLDSNEQIPEDLPEDKGEQKEEQDNRSPKEREADELLAFIRKARQFCQARAADGHPLDEIGLRPVEYGAKMLRAGIPLKAIKHAMTMHWPPEARRAMGVTDYDVTKFRPKDRKDGVHAALPYVLALVSERIPVALVGPKGTGKTTLAGQVAKLLDLPFGMVSMTSGTSPSAFNGRPKIGGDGGVVQSQFEKIYAEGGIFLFDEMDAADENLLLLVNAALANGHFANSATGEIIEKHKDFIPMAGMNTLGLGAGRDYNSRNRLDAATLDRWNMGRVQINLDERVEQTIFDSILGR